MASIVQRFLDLIAPRFCCICGERLAPDEALICTACNVIMPRTGQMQAPDDNPMVRKFWGVVDAIDRGAGWIIYKAGSSTVYPIYRMKYFDNPQAGRDLGRLIGQEMLAAGFLDEVEAIIPMPLAPNRLRQRGYNQTEMLARGIADIARIAVRTDVISRKQFLVSQTKLTYAERRENVRGAYELIGGGNLAYKRVMLIDDVMTTGSTMTNAAQEIAKIEGIKITVACVGYISHSTN